MKDEKVIKAVETIKRYCEETIWCENCVLNGNICDECFNKLPKKWGIDKLKEQLGKVK